MDVITLVIVVILALVLYYYFSENKGASYWRSKGLEIFEGKAYGEMKKRGLKHAVVNRRGHYVYISTDLDVIKNMLQTDFEHFKNHSMPVNEKLDPLKAHLAFLTDDKWRNLRVKLTPTFTTGKMKMMFSTITDSAKGLLPILDETARIQDAVEFKDLMARFTTDVIGSCAFGIECNTLKNPDSEFRKYGTQINLINWRSKLSSKLPTIRELLGIKEMDPQMESFFIKLVEDMISYREKNNIYRKDFLHLLIQIKNRGKVADDEKIMDGSKTGNYMTLNEVAAQCYLFFFAGFDTSSLLLSFTFFLLCQNQDIQDKLREEINTVLKKHNGQITYESIMEMTYLDQVLHESLRMYPPVPLTGRRCNKAYQIPGTDITLDPGSHIHIPIYEIHHDPDVYPDPEKFDPDRFSTENKAQRHQYAFLPFGEGPRMCIGLRFGLLQAKVGMVTVLPKYRITLNKKTKLPLRFSPHIVLNHPDGGVWVNVAKLEK